ncbi:hypothetical protein ACFCP7_24830 [Paenibacillus elgii]
MTDLEELTAPDFSFQPQLKTLKAVYIHFKNDYETEAVEALVQKNNWVYKQPCLAGINITV